MVIARLQAFESAGADVLFAPGLHTLEAIGTVCNSLSNPLSVVVEMPGRPFSVQQLAAIGVKRISVGAILARLAYGSVVNAAAEIKASGTFSSAEAAIDYDELEDLFRR